MQFIRNTLSDIQLRYRISRTVTTAGYHAHGKAMTDAVASCVSSASVHPDLVVSSITDHLSVSNPNSSFRTLNLLEVLVASCGYNFHLAMAQNYVLHDKLVQLASTRAESPPQRKTQRLAKATVLEYSRMFQDDVALKRLSFLATAVERRTGRSLVRSLRVESMKVKFIDPRPEDYIAISPINRAEKESGGHARPLTWACPVCTFINRNSVKKCGACATARPSVQSSSPPASALPVGSPLSDPPSDASQPLAAAVVGTVNSAEGQKGGSSGPLKASVVSDKSPRANAAGHPLADKAHSPTTDKRSNSNSENARDKKSNSFPSVAQETAVDEPKQELAVASVVKASGTLVKGVVSTSATALPIRVGSPLVQPSPSHVVSSGETSKATVAVDKTAHEDVNGILEKEEADRLEDAEVSDLLRDEDNENENENDNDNDDNDDDGDDASKPTHIDPIENDDNDEENDQSSSHPSSLAQKLLHRNHINPFVEEAPPTPPRKHTSPPPEAADAFKLDDTLGSSETEEDEEIEEEEEDEEEQEEKNYL